MYNLEMLNQDANYVKENINKLMEINISSGQMVLQNSWLSCLDYCEIYTDGNTSGKDTALKVYKK